MALKIRVFDNGNGLLILRVAIISHGHVQYAILLIPKAYLAAQTIKTIRSETAYFILYFSYIHHPSFGRGGERRFKADS